MCGRFTQAQIAELDRALFKLLEIPPLQPRYNIAPTQDVPVIRADRDGRRRLEPLRWGLVPSWAGDLSIGTRMINARAEGLTQKPAFRDPFERRRCLVPADGFFEWQKTAGGKQPVYLQVCSARFFAFAGLWDTWLSHDTGPVESFTIVTTTANAVVEPIHDRMPVILPVTAYGRWLDPTYRDTKDLRILLEPYPAEDMTARRVSRAVNDVRNDGPECVEPLDSAE